MMHTANKTALQAAAACVVAAAFALSAVGLAFAADGSGGGSDSDTPVAGVDYVFSLQQTLALYGTTIGGTYYDNDAGLTRNITFNYLTDSLHVGDMSDAQNLKIGTGGRMTTSQRAKLQATPYLVYVAEPADWGGGAFVPTNSRVNVQLNTSVVMTGLNRFTQNICWTINNTSLSNTRYTKYYMYNGDNLLSPSYNQNAVDGGAAWVYSSGARSYFLLEMYARNPATEPQPDENYQGKYGIVSWGYDNTDTQISFNRQEYDFYNCGTVPNSGAVYLLVGCPITRQDTILPPSPTVTTPVTTMPTTTTRPASQPAPYSSNTTSDLSGISADLARIIRNQELQMEYQDWIGTNQMYAVDNLALICEKLDKIYELMQKQGDIVVNIENNIGTDLVDEIGAALSSYTTPASMPSFGDAPKIMAKFWDWIKTYPELYTMIIVGFTLALAKFIIFRGNAQ